MNEGKHKKILLERQKAFKTIFKNIKETFPFASKKEFLKFKSLYEKYYNKIKNISENDRNFFLHIEQFLASLKNSHTKLGNYPGKTFFKPKGYSVLFLNNKFYLRRRTKIIGGILSIDDEEPIKILNFNIKRISSSTRQYSIYRALSFLLLDQDGKPASIRLKNFDGKTTAIHLKREKNVFKPFKKLIETKLLSKQLGYIKILAWTGKEMPNLLDKKIDYFIKNKIKALIVDVRGNNGGNANIAHHFSSHLFNKKVLFAVTKRRSSKNNFRLFSNYHYVEPIKPYLNIPIILIVDVACFSSNEYFIGGLKDNKRAYLIGEITGGGSGNPKKFVIPYKNSEFELLVSTWQYYRPNKMLLEGKGVKPHLIIKPTLQDFIKRHDRVLEVAVKKATSII
ncbi:MAG: S41 family peptidase [Candidatus Azambacteria bacterium]|nr:S41 family peptidase [Candidatus Azambacteria bacterium]